MFIIIAHCSPFLTLMIQSNKYRQPYANLTLRRDRQFYGYVFTNS